MGEIVFFKSLGDFFSKRMLFYSLAPFFISTFLLFALFYYGGSEFSFVLTQGSQNGDFTFLDENSHPILAFLLGLGIVHIVLITLLGIFGSLGVILLSLTIAMIVVGFLTPLVVQSVRDKHYAHIAPAKPDNLWTVLLDLVFIFIKFIGIFLLCLPFLVLPFISFFIFNIPFFYLFYKFLMLDILSNGLSQDAHAIVYAHKNYLLFVMIGFYTLSMIPLFGLFFGLFFIIYLSHFILSKSR